MRKTPCSGGVGIPETASYVTERHVTLGRVRDIRLLTPGSNSAQTGYRL
jgi:hypothetical protein